MTKKWLSFLVFQIFCSAAFCESLPLGKMGKSFTPSKALEITWLAPTNVVPSKIWVYKIRPTKFSPGMISNLVEMGKLLPENNKKGADSGITAFISFDRKKSLKLDSASGLVSYEDAGDLSAMNAPSESEVQRFATNVLSNLGISLSGLKTKPDSLLPELAVFVPEIKILVKDSIFITNTPIRSVFFRRSLDGISFIGNDRGGNGWIYFAAQGAVKKISLKWPDLKRAESHATFSSTAIVKLIREGKSVYGYIPVEFAHVDLSSVKKLTIKKMEVCYMTGENSVQPIASLWTSAEIAGETIEMEIDCPIIENGK